MDNNNLNKKQKNETNLKEKIYDVIVWIAIIISFIVIFCGIIIGIIAQAFEIVALDGEGSNVGIPSLQLSISLFLATLFALAILILLIYKLFWKKINSHLEIRKTNIETNIKAASYKNEEANKNLIKSEKELKAIKTDGEEIIKNAITEANIEKSEIKKDAKKTVDDMIKKSRDQILKEKESMSDEIRQEIIETAIIAAKKIIENELDEETNSKMINELIDSL